MKIVPASGPAFSQEAVAVFFTKESFARQKKTRFEKVLHRLSAAGRFEARFDERLALYDGARVQVAVGLGKESELTPTQLRVAVKHLIGCEPLAPARALRLVPHAADEAWARAYLEGVLLGGYSWDKYVSRRTDRRVRPAQKEYSFEGFPKKLVDEALAVCRNVNYVRDLVNDNADTVNSVFFEEEVVSLVKGRPGVELTVLKKKDLESLGMNLMLAVNRGSQYPPKLIIVRYNGAADRGEKYTALVGKGLTFDSGGLNIKGTGNIEEMRLDMAGAGAVLGVLRNTLHFKPAKNLLFVFALVENAVDAMSYKPGDVYVGYAGKSVEIANTDAEGRLVLADANAYVCKNFPVKTLVNIATLTGAVLVALAQDHSALMSDDETLASDLLDCARLTDDRAWRLPNYPELGQYIRSRYADLRNTTVNKGQGGTLVGGEFLRQFVSGGAKWAHLDIAGTAFINQSEHWYYSYGATGAGTRLLTRYVLDRA